MKKMMIVLAVMGFAVGAYAADAVKPADAAKAEAIKKADADKDGKVTVLEYITFYKLDAAAGKKADKNADGIIAVDEFVVIGAATAKPAAAKQTTGNPMCPDCVKLGSNCPKCLAPPPEGGLLRN